MTDKYIKDGKVAVLYSSDYGAGWYTWNTELGEDLIYDPKLVELVLEAEKINTRDAYIPVVAYCKEKWPKAFHGGCDDLVVEWVPQGVQFYIREYDGAESVCIIHGDFGFIA